MRLMRSTPRAPRAASCARGAAARAGCRPRAPADRSPRPAPKPSTSRSVTTRRCISGSVSIAARTCCTASPESAIDSALPLHGRIGEAQWPAPGSGARTNARDPRPARPRRPARATRTARSAPRERRACGRGSSRCGRGRCAGTSGPRTCRGRGAGRPRLPGRRPRRSPVWGRTDAPRARARRGGARRVARRPVRRRRAGLRAGPLPRRGLRPSAHAGVHGPQSPSTGRRYTARPRRAPRPRRNAPASATLSHL